jgi:hypothetical protein
MKEILSQQNSRQFLAKLIPDSLLGVSSGYFKRALVDESGMIRTNNGERTIDQKMIAVHETPVRHHTVTMIVTVFTMVNSAVTTHSEACKVAK